MKNLFNKIPYWVVSGISIFPVLILLGGLLYLVSWGKISFLFWMVIPSIIFEETLEKTFYAVSDNMFLNLVFIGFFWFTISALTGVIIRLLKK